jgi:hypothetical protein
VEDPQRRRAAHIPVVVTFQTKAEIALELVDRATAEGVRHACVVADADYGDNPAFLNGLEARRERYCVAVRADFRVQLTRGEQGQRHRVNFLCLRILLAAGRKPYLAIPGLNGLLHRTSHWENSI